MSVKVKYKGVLKGYVLKENEKDENTGFSNFMIKVEKKFKDIVGKKQVLYFQDDDSITNITDQAEWAYFVGLVMEHQKNTGSNDNGKFCLYLSKEELKQDLKPSKSGKKKKNKKKKRRIEPSEESEDESSDEEPVPKKNNKHKKICVHRNIECNGCGITSIKGDRYQCTNKPNYNLCATCEKESNRFFPVIKFKQESDFRNPVLIEREELERLKRKASQQVQNPVLNEVYNPNMTNPINPPSFPKPDDNNKTEMTEQEKARQEKYVIMECSVGSGNEDIKEQLMNEFGHLNKNDFYNKLVANLNRFPNSG